MAFRGKRSSSKFSRGGSFDKKFEGPPERIMSLGFFIHPCQGDLVVKSEINDVPYFNAPIFIENKMCVGKIDEIFGSLHDFYVSVKLNDCISVASFKIKQKLFIDPAKLLPIKRFLPQQPRAKRCLVFSRGASKNRGNGQRGRFKAGRGKFSGRGSGAGHFGFRGRRGGRGQRGR
ncbi:H/ACA ribonucleoprotein complex subunit 1-like [Lycorma delicatula]|uniref:H/ACA ribonucleoprotein complex subunit 1-like n=1 Tax=Lycorma delicatula TaxID=130591 RepID=UPI003F517B54